MISAIIYLLLGAFIGWNLPQPEWATKAQSKVLNFFRGTK